MAGRRGSIEDVAERRGSVVFEGTATPLLRAVVRVRNDAVADIYEVRVMITRRSYGKFPSEQTAQTACTERASLSLSFFSRGRVVGQ